MTISSITKPIKSLLIKYFTVIIIIVVVIVLGAGYLIFIRQTVCEIQRIGVVDLKMKQDELAAKQLTVKKLADLKARYDSITSDEMQTLGYLLPHQQDVPNLVIELKNMVKNSNLVLDAIDAGPLGGTPAVANTNTAAPAGVKTLGITLSVHGVDSYTGLKNFLDTLAHQQPLLELTSLSYAPGGDSYSLNLTTYYQ